MKKVTWPVWVAIALSAVFVGLLVFIKVVKTYKLESTLGWNGWTDLSLVAIDIVFVAPAAGVFWIIGAVQTIRRRRKQTGS